MANPKVTEYCVLANSVCLYGKFLLGGMEDGKFKGQDLPDLAGVTDEFIENHVGKCKHWDNTGGVCKLWS